MVVSCLRNFLQPVLVPVVNEVAGNLGWSEEEQHKEKHSDGANPRCRSFKIDRHGHGCYNCHRYDGSDNVKQVDQAEVERCWQLMKSQTNHTYYDQGEDRTNYDGNVFGGYDFLAVDGQAVYYDISIILVFRLGYAQNKCIRYSKSTHAVGEVLEKRVGKGNKQKNTVAQAEPEHFLLQYEFLPN